MFDENIYYDKNKKRQIFAGVIISGNDNNVLLGLKKTGFGRGLWNHSFVGKVERGEEIEEAARRELEEESGLTVEKDQLEKVGYFEYEFQDKTIYPRLMILHIYKASCWSGRVRESEEMKPQWCHHSQVPFNNMWPDNQFWLNKVLEGRKVKAYFLYRDYSNIERHRVEVVETLN